MDEENVVLLCQLLQQLGELSTDRAKELIKDLLGNLFD